jgi:hypothetical protein
MRRADPCHSKSQLRSAKAGICSQSHLLGGSEPNAPLLTLHSQTAEDKLPHTAAGPTSTTTATIQCLDFVRFGLGNEFLHREATASVDVLQMHQDCAVLGFQQL